jgi:hypothetical protein
LPPDKPVVAKKPAIPSVNVTSKRTKPARRPQQAAQRNSQNGSLRVYDAQGRPVNPKK